MENNQQNIQNSPIETTKNTKDKNKTYMVLSIVFSSIALFFLLTILVLCLVLFKDSSDESLFGLAFVLFLFSYGIILYVPTIVFSILGIMFSSLGLKNTIKKRKTTCIIFLCLDILILVGLVALFLVSMFMANAG